MSDKTRFEFDQRLFRNAYRRFLGSFYGVSPTITSQLTLGLNFFSLSVFLKFAVYLGMNDFTDALMIALRSGQEDPTANELGVRMKALIAELSNPSVAKTQRAKLNRELAQVREAYRRNLLSR